MSSKPTNAELTIILDHAKKHEEWYSSLESNFPITDFSDKEIRGLVSGTENQNEPLHGWYTLKEAYDHELPTWAVEYISTQYGASIRKVLDPFVGGGTTGVSLSLMGLEVYGVEYNPFIYLVSKCKSQYPILFRSEVQAAMESIKLHRGLSSKQIPKLSTFDNKKYFSQDDLRVLAYAVYQIKRANFRDEIKDFLMLGIASSINDVANLRKDGRALRYEVKENKLSAKEALLKRWDNMIQDLEKIQFLGKFIPRYGNATQLLSSVKERNFDLALYSPPYLNNFDYSEIYKLELWMLGLITTYAQWRELRQHTLRSHGSIQFYETSYLCSDHRMTDIHNLISELSVSKCLYDAQPQMKPVITGYFEDMYISLKQQWKVLKPGGFLAYVVANSRHKYLPIATDVIIGSIACRLGFIPKELIILKKRNGRTRQKAYLRESMVILQKPLC